MTDIIDTYLLKSGMAHGELCAIRHRRLLYTGIAIVMAATIASVALVLFAPIQA